MNKHSSEYLYTYSKMATENSAKNKDKGSISKKARVLYFLKHFSLAMLCLFLMILILAFDRA